MSAERAASMADLLMSGVANNIKLRELQQQMADRVAGCSRDEKVSEWRVARLCLYAYLDQKHSQYESSAQKLLDFCTRHEFNELIGDTIAQGINGEVSLEDAKQSLLTKINSAPQEHRALYWCEARLCFLDYLNSHKLTSETAVPRQNAGQLLNFCALEERRMRHPESFVEQEEAKRGKKEECGHCR